MSILSNILEKLGLKKTAAATAAAARVPEEMKAKPGAGLFGTKAMSQVDVTAKLDALAKKTKPADLNWRISIADLLYLLGIDNSYNNRKALATELGCPANFMNDSAAMNTWLHKTVLQKIAENGGNIPKNLLD